jgi:hypothetical protein
MTSVAVDPVIESDTAPSAAAAFAALRRFGDRKPSVRLHPILKTTAIPANPAAIADAIRLPEFASRYANIAHDPQNFALGPCRAPPSKDGSLPAPRNVDNR